MLKIINFGGEGSMWVLKLKKTKFAGGHGSRRFNEFFAQSVFVRSSLLFAQKFLKWPFLGPYCTQNAVLGGKHAQIKKRLHIGMINIPQNVYLAGSVF